MKPEKEAFAAVWRHKGFWAAQVFAFAIWAALAMSWLWLPDSKTWGVAMSVVQACVVLVSAVWLMAVTFVFYRGAHEEKKLGLPAVYWEGLRRCPPLLVWAAFGGVALLLLPRWAWLAIALLLLPVAARITAKGAHTAWSARYFVQFAILAVVGVLAPALLIGWHPGLPGVALQTASLAARFVVAYLLAITSWLVLASLLSASAQPGSQR